MLQICLVCPEEVKERNGRVKVRFIFPGSEVAQIRAFAFCCFEEVGNYVAPCPRKELRVQILRLVMLVSCILTLAEYFDIVVE